MGIEQQLHHATCGQPFSHLGINQNEQSRQILQVWQPDAVSVSVCHFADKTPLGKLKRINDSGLFCLDVTDIQNFHHYVLQVENEHSTYPVIDPYQFKEEAFHAVHYVDAAPENLYKQIGAQLVSVSVGDDEVKGTRFSVFAPNASAVSVIGEFNLWNGQYHPMEKTSFGYWVLFIPEVSAGCQYKFQLKDIHGHELPHKADPMGYHAEQYPSHTSIVYDHNNFEWSDKQWLDKQRNTNKYTTPMSVYEVHLGSWKRPSEPDKQYLTYQELADDLVSYVKDMGYTHLEVLPVSEHPFDGSWGYQPVGLFAPTSRFGHPDEFKYFVNACHVNDIAVIIDWVPAHFPEDGHGLARFDGSHLYEYEDPRKGWHPDWNSCIYDFGKDTVRQFLVANALYWMDKFHIDGLRVDAVASMLYLDYSRNDGEWIPNVDGGNLNYEAISLLQWMNTEVYNKHPHGVTIAEESTSYPKVSRPVDDGGLGFGFKWNMGWMHDSLHYISKDPAYRHYHHGELTFSLVYAFDENFVLPISHDEVVHGKGSMLRKMPGDEWQQAANLRAYAGFMYGHPGKKLNFMGTEIAQSREWDHDSSIDWHLLEYDKHAGVQAVYRDLNHLYANQLALHQEDHIHTGFAWLEHENAELSIIAFVRYDHKSKEKVYVVSNFTPTPRDNYNLGVEDSGEYRVLLNTDDSQYWGSDYWPQRDLSSQNQPAHGKVASIQLNIPPLATLFIAIKG